MYLIRTSKRRLACSILSVALLCFVGAAQATTIRELSEVRGARGNDLIGVGFVVGLSGTGDSSQSSIAAQERVLESLGFDVTSLSDLASANSAMVIVTTTIPAFAKEGTRIDVQVASLSDATSLEGGTLLLTQLKFPGATNETVYAIAQGPISVGGFNVDASGGTGVRNNHVTSGRIPMGAYVEREVPSTITDGHRIVLLVKRPDFGVANSIQNAVNKKYDEQTAMAFGAGAVRINIPQDKLNNLTAFIAELQDTRVTTRLPSRVVFNERTGTLVMGGEVVIKPCYVAHGSLTIRIATTPAVTPALSFTDAQATVTETSELTVETEEAVFMPVEGSTAGEVAEALNRLRVTPRDMISIFQALREQGALEADLEIM
jgi:flagellar P-ring protein precursor FlgI